ncbi:MAG: RAMP superfamily CRISPR-associated protein, partial [Candidatus Eremiobacterota bacterium]
QDQPCDQKCPVCRLFGTTKFANDNNPLRSRIFFRDAYPYDNDKIQLYPIDNVPICRLSGKGLNKSNLLFAYGPEAYMETRILIKNIKSNDRWILALLGHILKDFYYGDIPVGSGKFCGLGRLHGNVTSIKVGCHKDTWLYNTLHSLGHTPETGFFWEEAVFNPFTVSNYTAVLDDLQTSFIALGGVK